MNTAISMSSFSFSSTVELTEMFEQSWFLSSLPMSWALLQLAYFSMASQLVLRRQTFKVIKCTSSQWTLPIYLMHPMERHTGLFGMFVPLINFFSLLAYYTNFTATPLCFTPNWGKTYWQTTFPYSTATTQYQTASLPALDSNSHISFHRLTTLIQKMAIRDSCSTIEERMKQCRNSFSPSSSLVFFAPWWIFCLVLRDCGILELWVFVKESGLRPLCVY